MTLKIYAVVLELVRKLSPYLPALRARSSSLGDQLERALVSSRCCARCRRQQVLVLRQVQVLLLRLVRCRVRVRLRGCRYSLDGFRSAQLVVLRRRSIAERSEPARGARFDAVSADRVGIRRLWQQASREPGNPHREGGKECLGEQTEFCG